VAPDRAPADWRTKSAYLPGAVCPKRGTGAAVIMPSADTQAMQHHLEEIARNPAGQRFTSARRIGRRTAR
jgi:hypothetical protein